MGYGLMLYTPIVHKKLVSKIHLIGQRMGAYQNCVYSITVFGVLGHHELRPVAFS